MTIQRMLELLEIEHKCMLRGAHDDCDRNCADCELVQDDYELHEMYTDVISLLKDHEPVKPNRLPNKKVTSYKNVVYQYSCGNCSTLLRNSWKACPLCGKPVKWE